MAAGEDYGYASAVRYLTAILDEARDDLTLWLVAGLLITKLLVHLVDVSSASGRDPVEDFDTIRDELRQFDPAVAAKPQIVVATKIDALDDATRLDRLRRHVRKKRLPFAKISSVSGEGLDELLETVWRGIVAARDVAVAPEPDPVDEGIDLLTPRLRHDA